jgi:GH15 family glucan-1,4-alpha-glucosidase
VLDGPMWEMMRTLVEYVCAHWREPDRGIWEVRGDPRHFVYSKVMFWLVDNLAMQGRVAEAGSLFERSLTYGGRLGLFSEEINSHDSVAVGNYPQAFTHIALINSAINLQKAVERLDARYSEPILAALTIKLQEEERDSCLLNNE